MNLNQRHAFILAVLGFLPPACHSPAIHHSVEHYVLLISFLIGMLGFGWLISIYRQ
jgi:hypothetical protein